MKFEVEQKHRIDDSAALERRLAERGAILDPPILQTDEYFNHPCRDFATTDEALRIRTAGEACLLTYKGPKLDATTKTRRELELPVAGSRAEFADLLAALSFRAVATITKTRRAFQLIREGQLVHGAWDEVEGVGTFLELEISADETLVDQAKRIIASLADELMLGPSERRSYLELQLSRQR